MAAGRIEAQARIHLMESVAEGKLLDFKSDKFKFMVVGGVKKHEELEKDLKKATLKLCDDNMK